jgi:hypothetical protein
MSAMDLDCKISSQVPQSCGDESASQQSSPASWRQIESKICTELTFPLTTTTTPP